MNILYPKRLKAALFTAACTGLSFFAQAQYCTPVCATGCTVGGGDYIQSFSTTGGSTNITNNNTGCNGNANNYIYYNTMTVTAAAGNSVGWSYTNCNTDPQGYMIWVDWNADGDFSDSMETVFSTTSATAAGATVTGTITVPTWATTGVKRLRIRSSWNQNNFSPCASQWYGETEDYNFQVGTASGCNGTPVAGTLSASPSAALCASTPATLMLTGNTAGAVYQWQMSPNGNGWTNITGATSTVYHLPIPVFAAYYRVLVICGGAVANSNTVSITVNAAGTCQDSVWPGDTNYDLTVDNMDVFNVALGYGFSGLARTGASSSWVPQFAIDWYNNFNSGVNYKHADCNGDSIINTGDLAVIAANYGQTHPKGEWQNAARVAGLPDLYFDFTGINLIPGTTVTVPLKMGSAAAPVNKIYGIAGTVKINGITPQAAPVMSFNNGWLGANTLNLVKLINNNKVDWAYAHKDHLNSTGYGTLGTLTFDVPHGATGSLTLQLQQVKMIDSAGAVITAYNVVDATKGIQSSGIPANNLPVGLSIAPNPSGNKAALYITAAGNAALQLRITDITGKQVWTDAVSVDKGTNTYALPAQRLAAGSYFIEVSGLGEPKLIRWIRE